MTHLSPPSRPRGAHRWAPLASAVSALVVAACSARPLPLLVGTPDARDTTPDASGASDGDAGWQWPKVDILFMIDNSGGMGLPQANLVSNLVPFMNVLKGLPNGLPDVHIAVVTSDMGAGDGSFFGCDGNGDNGVFQFAPTGDCLATTLQPGATFIADTGGVNPVTNFTAPDITTVLQCIMAVGTAGCGFEHQLAAVARALGADGAPPPRENRGFLRDEAYLEIIILSNEDDCSAPVNSPLYQATGQTTLASSIGPPGNYRCNEFGHLCGNPPKKPPRLSPNPGDLTTEVTLDDCVSAEDQGLLTPVATFARGIKALKADPAEKILITSIQGPVTPYTVHWTAPPTNDTGPWPSIEHSCTATDSSSADPGVRLQLFAQQFGGNGLTYSICSDNFGPALNTLAMKLSVLPP